MSRILALAAMPLALLALLLPGQAAAATGAASRPGCLITILCPSPSPTPTPTASGSAAPSADPTPSPSATAGAAPAPSASASASPSAPSPSTSASDKAATKKASSKKAAAPPGLVITSAQFSLATGSAVMSGATYDGTAQVPTASGGTIEMLKFSMSGLTLDGTPTLTVVRGGVTSHTSGSSMRFTGNVTLYATKLSGDLLGVPLTITPGSPLALFTSLLNGIPLTDVTTDLPLISADSLQVPGLQVVYG